MDNNTDVPIYEIDPSKKYILSFPMILSAESRDRIQHDIKEWLNDKDKPFMLIMGGVRLLKIEEADKKEE